jgi:hypothetical protein
VRETQKFEEDAANSVHRVEEILINGMTRGDDAAVIISTIH